MKKIWIILAVLLFIIPISTSANENDGNGEYAKSALTSALYPYVEKAVADYKKNTPYYAPFRMNHPLYQIDMLDIQKKNSNSFLVKIRLQTYEHAHSAPHFDVTTTLDVSPHAIKVTNVEVDEDSTARAIEAFYQKAVADIAQSFNLNLETYNVYNAAELTGELRNIVLSIERNVLNLEFQPPYKNVIDPVTFLKGDKGYILFKKSDGTNVVYTVHKADDTWKIKNKASKHGEKMTEEIIWYM